MAERDELISAIGEAIAPMWRDIQDRMTNLRDTLRTEIKESESRVTTELGARIDKLDTRLASVESNLAQTMASVEKLWERQPIVIDFERFRKIEERLARLEEKLEP
jgi:tetrahydromethanopterin S-methyltransferase subunit G